MTRLRRPSFPGEDVLPIDPLVPEPEPKTVANRARHAEAAEDALEPLTAANPPPPPGNLSRRGTAEVIVEWPFRPTSDR